MKMLNKLVEDLRFVIGLFFGVVSLLLFLAGTLGFNSPQLSFNLNWMAGSYMGVFSVIMLTLAGYGVIKR